MPQMNNRRRKPGKLLFGVELELVLESKTGFCSRNWDDSAQELSELLSQGGIENEKIDTEKKPNYNVWTIANDGSIQLREVDEDADVNKRWGVELISNICVSKRSRSPWMGSLKILWECLDTQHHIRPSTSCGTHVHVSLARVRGWDLKLLKDLARAVVYFERAIDSLLVQDHPDRVSNFVWCKSDRYNDVLRQYTTMDEVYRAIDEIGGISDERHHHDHETGLKHYS